LEGNRKERAIRLGVELLTEVMSGSPARSGSPVDTGRAVEQVQADPGDLRKWEGLVDLQLLFKVTGQTSGTVYGTDVYTSDSPLATAAVHAGVLQPGETGVVRVWVVPVLPSYRGTSRNGVVSRDWSTSWTGAYRIERA
jgi:hypothetical protein